MLNIALIDRDQTHVEIEKTYIDKYFSEQSEKMEYKISVFETGKQFFSSYDVFDIIFTEMKISSESGLDIARAYRGGGGSASIIFVTEMADMAIYGYEVNAIDFLLKPVPYRVFSNSLEKAVRRVVGNARDCIMLASSRRIIKLSVRDILFVESVKHKIIYHTVWGDFDDWGSISVTEEKLAEFGFIRCNSCYLVNLSHVEQIVGNEVVLGPYRLTISRNRKTPFVRTFLAHIGDGVM